MLFLRIVNGNCTILSEYRQVAGQVWNNRDYNGVLVLAMHFNIKPYSVIIAMLAVLSLCPAHSLCQTGKSGITGVVEERGRPGPTRPNDVPRYYSGLLEIMRVSDGKLAGKTTSDASGKFTIALEPGEYFITQTDPSRSRIHSEPITVEKGKFTTVKIDADNGMR